MTAGQFRRLALALPAVAEGRHQDHPDFRVAGRIFATLGFPDEGWGMIRLSAVDQAALVAAERPAYRPAAGAWGQRGATLVSLAEVAAPSLRAALDRAWQWAQEAKSRKSAPQQRPRSRKRRPA